MEKCDIFLDDADRKDFVQRLSRLLAETHTECLVWVLMLNHLHLPLRPKGQMLAHPKRYLAILDGLVGGSKESPLSPTPVQSGLMLASRNHVALDAVVATLMGFDISRIPQIMEAFNMKVMQLAEFTLEEIEIRGSLSASSIHEIYQTKCFRSFQPSIGYKGHLEYQVPYGLS